MIHVVAESAVGRVACLRLAGDLTCHSMPVVAEVCAGYVHQGVGQVQMDLADLWSVDVLSCWALARLPWTGIRVQFTHPRPLVRTLLDSFGMGRWIVADPQPGRPAVARRAPQHRGCRRPACRRSACRATADAQSQERPHV